MIIFIGSPSTLGVAHIYRRNLDCHTGGTHRAGEFAQATEECRICSQGKMTLIIIKFLCDWMPDDLGHERAVYASRSVSFIESAQTHPQALNAMKAGDSGASRP